MISATVTGNLGSDARRGMAGDTPVLNVSVASRRYDSKEKKEVTDWIDVAFFGQRAEKIAQYLTKGSRIAARGTIHVREYTHNNEKRAGLTMRADDIELLGGGEQKQAQQASAPHADDLPF